MQSWKNHIPLYSFSVLCALCVFSYLPLLQFGMITGTHIDVSLVYIALMFTAICAVPEVWRHRTVVWSYPAWRWLIAYQLFVSLSVLWSQNVSRALLTIAFGWALIAVVSLVLVYRAPLKRHSPTIERWVRIAIYVSLWWAGWQLIGDAFHMPNWTTLLPPQYGGDVFGVARPTAFALEPQFFGSLLLVVFGIGVHRSITQTQWSDGPLLVVVTTFLLLTLSRGALVASVAIVVLLIATQRHSRRALLRTGGLLVLGVGIGFVTLFCLASIRGGAITSGAVSVRAAVEHLSVGYFRFSTPSQPTHSVASVASPTPSYIQSSTDSRLSMAQVALQIWRSSPLTGVGVGSFGAASRELSPIYPLSTVANNYYLELLAEVGMIGLLLFGGFITTILHNLGKQRNWLLLALLVGVLSQWWFFSGNANVIHVWILLGIAAAATPIIKKKR